MSHHAFSRRLFFTGAGASALGASALLAGCSKDSPADAAVKFDGEHQAGITTTQQDRMHFAAFKVVTEDRDELAGLLKQWTSMARRMTRGETTVDQSIDDVGQHSVPKDTGEAYDLRPSFIYAVSSASVTGAQKSFDEAKQAYFKRLEDMQLRNPLLVGFGISNRATRQAACNHTAGVIVGSKFVTLLQQASTPTQAVEQLLQALNK